MPRSPLAYLNDIVEACDAVAVTLKGVDLGAYESNRTIRSAVEREFTIIGEAVNSLSRLDPKLSTRISHARKIANHDAPVLRSECAVLIEELRRAD